MANAKKDENAQADPEKLKAEEAERAQQAAASRAQADIEAKAAGEARDKAQAKEQQARRDEAAEVTDGEFAGHIYTSENFVASTSESFGRAVIEVKPAGWVGEGFVIPASRVEEFKKLISSVKNAPKG